MIILFSILIFIILVLLLILILPVRIEVDTKKEFLRVYMPFFFSGGLYELMSDPDIRLRFALIRISPGIFMKSKKEKKTKEKLSEKKKGKKTRKKLTLAEFLKILRTMAGKIRIKKLIWEIDTGDFPLNAKLYPLTGLLTEPGKAISINFEGRNTLYLLIQTRIISLLIIIIKYKLSNLKFKKNGSKS
jgi:hypothetical protein